MLGKFLWKPLSASAVLRETKGRWSMNTFEPELFKERMRGSSEGEAHKGKMVPRCQSLAIFSTPRGARFCFIKGDGVPFQGYSESDSQRPSRAGTMLFMPLHPNYLVQYLTHSWGLVNTCWMNEIHLSYLREYTHTVHKHKHIFRMPSMCQHWA